MMSQELLHKLFDYCPDSGVVSWRISRSNRIKVGSTVGYENPYGYLQVRIEGKLWMLHRLIWEYVTGFPPKQMIDHINGDRSDNRFANLRDVSRSINNQNRKGPDRDAKIQLLGVCFDTRCRKYRAQMRVNGKSVLNKVFGTPEEAHMAYLRAKEIYHHF